MTATMDPPAAAASAPAADLPAARAAFLAARDETKQVVIESEEMIDALFRAAISRTHVYVSGSGGVGKTFGAEEMSRHFGVPTFYVQFRADTKREEVFGPLSMTALQQDVYKHATQGYLPEAVIANLDEFKDAGKFTRQLLNILNERWFVNGGVRTTVPLRTAIGTTNFWIEEQELDALFDRFAQRLVQEPVKTSNGFKSILGGALSRDFNEVQGVDRTSNYTMVTLEQLTALTDAVLTCTVHADILELVDGLRQQAEGEGILVSPRRYIEGLKLARAEAVIDGRDHVIETDLRPFALVLRNHPDDFTVARDLCKGFRDPITEAVEEAQNGLAEVRAAMQPLKDAKAKGESPDLSGLTPISQLIRTINEKCADVKKAHSGRDLAQLERVLEQLAPEETLLHELVFGKKR